MPLDGTSYSILYIGHLYLVIPLLYSSKDKHMWEQHSILGRWGVGGEGGVLSQSKKKDRPLIINSDPASPLPYALLFFRHFLHHPHVVTLFPPCWRLLFNSLLSSIDSSVLGDFVTSVAVAIAQLRPHPSPFIRGFGAPLFCHRSPHVTMPLRGHLHGPTKK